ncbi:MAG: prephenate dehydrogenase [Myxococcota bacterium]
MPHEPPESLGVIGLGLIGGSIVLGIRRCWPTCTIIGIDNEPTARQQALLAGAIDEAYGTPTQAMQRCDLIVVATPLGALRQVFTELGQNLRPTALVFDVCGVKSVVQEWADELLPPGQFIGTHPMAGGEKAGFAQAHAGLFHNSIVALCPTPQSTQNAVLRVRALWEHLGATCLEMSGDFHDRVVAQTSHLPYINALALRRLATEDIAGCALRGKGWIDATRHADFSPHVMGSVCAANPYLPKAMREMAKEIERLADMLEINPDDFVNSIDKAAK